ncbi:hypothetical protein N7462_005367 [Penicillium macrosclerotiorum]|uniref:uncharacterized protein n=1 Tax=Penicillium macrosclerotiorum TaxID=303699 RepID=UPI0025469DBB|nr:uncharacterized protein N7462_005367 [Penicillium macrosclerotiorum]KAJ5682202.1 hypothetical protein N7462_005367 [Penicillium macrosclerotiorum]
MCLSEPGHGTNHLAVEPLGPLGPLGPNWAKHRVEGMVNTKTRRPNAIPPYCVGSTKYAVLRIPSSVLDLDPSVSSACSASSPPFHPRDARIIHDESRLAPSLLLSSPSSGDSSLSAAGSPSHRPSPRSITLEPPPLPFLAATQRRPQESLTSSPDNRRAESSVYYTTAWGSPYAAPSTRRLSLTLSQYAGATRESRESSPGSSIANQIEFRRASVAQELTGNQASQSIRDFTQDWINQYLSGQTRTERSNWLSDDSGSEAPSFFTAQNQLADDLSDDWLGLEDNIRDNELLKTPTLSDFVGRRTATRTKVKKTQHKRADTLRQEDFWGFAYDKESPKNVMSDINDSQLPVEATSPAEKPLPAPPGDFVEEITPAEGPEGSANPDDAKELASQINRASPQTPRRKKKIIWNRKTCIIDLPVDDKRGTEESGYRLLTRAEVEQQLKKWEDDGYDVRGFTVGATDDPSAPTELGGLSRPLYPDPYTLHEETKGQKAHISFPDKAVWDAYVADLQEEKLRALGVVFDEPKPQPSISPASAAMHPGQSPFPGLVASPPIPTDSASSNPLAPMHPFSPHFGQSTATTSGGIASLASPASQFSVQTPFMGMEQNLLTGYPFQFQPTPPAQGAMTPQSLINIRQASGSAGPGPLSNFNSMLSPVSPMHDQTFHAGFNDSKDGFDDRFINVGHEEPPYPTPQTPVHEPDHFHASNVEIAHPTPRGHGHNLSETLQRGLDQMNNSHYHMDDTIEQQLHEDHDATHHVLNAGVLQSHWALPGHDQQHHAQHISRQASHSFSQQPHQFYNEQLMQHNPHEGSDLDTNPSLAGTPHVRGVVPDQGPWHEPKASHHSKLSISSLNVEAKEFDPTASFNSQPSSFTNSGFQPGGMGQQGFGFAPAPPFVPPGMMNGSINPKPEPRRSSFKFSAASFNVDAPVFNPSASLNSNASSEQLPGNRAKIFGDIDLAEISKPPKQSKAIPIVRPDETEPSQDDHQETIDNENGRPVPTDRHKRARRGIGHAEGEARYSISSHPLGEAGNVQTSSNLHALAEGKENALPEVDKLIERKGTPMSEATTWTLFDAKNEGEAARSHTSSPAQIEDTAEVQEQPLQEAQADPEEPTRDAVPARHVSQESQSSLKNTMLSPTAKSFEFKPAVSEFVPASLPPSSFGESDPPKVESTEPKPVETRRSGLMASRFAMASPPKPEPASVEKSVQEQTPQHFVPQADLSRWQESAEESPDDEELNAIMEQLNDDSDVGIERQHTPLPPQFITSSAPTKEQRFGSVEARSEAPSPSPGGGQKTYKLDIPRLGSDIDANSNATFSPQKSLISRIQSPVRQLITENDHVSDWDDMISSGEDEKFFNRNRFFDRRINDLVGSAIDDRLGPMERALAVIQTSVASIASGTASRRAFHSPSEIDDSDADDEDDGEDHERSVRDRSPAHMRDRKLDMLKSVVMEALVTHDLPNRGNQHSSHSEMAQLKESIAELQALTIKKLAQDPVGDMREILEETLTRQLAQQTPRLSEADEIGADSLMLQIDGLKSMLRLADERAESEYKQRRDATDSISELQRLLKLAEDDAARHMAAAENAEARFLQFKEEKIPHLEKMQFRTNALDEENETLKVTLAELSSKNIALEGTLDEHRVSSDHLRRQLETVSSENKSLHETVDHLRTRIEDSMAARQNLTEKFDRLQADMVTVTSDVTREQATWRRREEEQAAKYNELRASNNREIKLREQLELEVAEFEKQEKEAAKIKFIHEQSQQENARLEDTISNLRAENHELQLKAARFEREFNEARESSRMEIQRTRTSMEADLEASNSQVNIVRAELEAQIIRLQSQLDNVRMDADTSRERYELLLEEANESKATSLAAAKESREVALEDQRKTHERVLNDLRERHARALHNSSEDRQRGEAHMLDRLALSDDKAKHLQDRVQHLEEKLEIAQSAARAAAEAAQTAKAGPGMFQVPAPATHATSPSMSFSKGSQEPEKISPQALRESILVLQDQLQQRETRIEELEQEVTSVDKDAPNKIKERDSEINWLRELLGVRIDDLQDIIKTLSQPTFNKHAVRDAAIRLKANLQMQQQERERAVSGNGRPSLPSISDLAASPRSLPLAAAAAWGNWRKGRDSGAGSAEQTPSKSSNAGTFLSGLLTPPSSHVRQNAPLGAAPIRSYSESRPLRGLTSTPRRGSVRQEAPIAEAPKTPPLLRRSSYDHDAEPANYEDGGFTADDIESTVDGMVSASPKDAADEGPFGPQIAAVAEAIEEGVVE